jgi:2-methylcitrate dehydratase PrpD
MGEPTLVQRLASFAAGQTATTVPAEVTASVRRRVLDTVGIALAATALPTSRAALSLVADTGGAPQARAIGLEVSVPAAQAAFANGVLAHSLDYDDTHLPSVLHPSASVIPAALATAEQIGASGGRLAAAVAVGLELCVRLGMAGYDRDTGNSLFFEHGQHATSICGAVAAAAAAAHLRGGGASAIADAMGVAVSMAGGVLEANRTGGTVKRIHCGWAAHAGVIAADLVERGLTGPPTVLEGRFGFFRAFLNGVFSAEALLDGLGERWEVPGIFFKPYPANHFTHTGIDAARRLRADGLDPDDVAELALSVATPTVRTIGEPIEVKRRPETGYQAQFSAPYTVVAGLLGGSGLGVGLDDFTDELATDPYRRALMAKVSVGSDPQLDRIYPYQFPARLRAVTRDGRELAAKVLVNRGGPDDPLSDEELVGKFRDNATRALDDAHADRIVDASLRLDGLDDLTPLTAPLGAPAQTGDQSRRVGRAR